MLRQWPVAVACRRGQERREGRRVVPEERHARVGLQLDPRASERFGNYPHQRIGFSQQLGSVERAQVFDEELQEVAEIRDHAAGAAELAAAQAAAVARGLGAAAQKANVFLLREPLPVPRRTRRAHMRIAQTRML
jgi:hypothetical protein